MSGISFQAYSVNTTKSNSILRKSIASGITGAVPGDVTSLNVTATSLPRRYLLSSAGIYASFIVLYRGATKASAIGAVGQLESYLVSPAFPAALKTNGESSGARDIFANVTVVDADASWMAVTAAPSVAPSTYDSITTSTTTKTTTINVNSLYWQIGGPLLIISLVLCILCNCRNKTSVKVHHVVVAPKRQQKHHEEPPPTRRESMQPFVMMQSLHIDQPHYPMESEGMYPHQPFSRDMEGMYPHTPFSHEMEEMYPHQSFSRNHRERRQVTAPLIDCHLLLGLTGHQGLSGTHILGDASHTDRDGCGVCRAAIPRLAARFQAKKVKSLS